MAKKTIQYYIQNVTTCKTKKRLRSLVHACTHACALKGIRELIAQTITRMEMYRLLARTHTKTRARAKSHTMRHKIHAFSLAFCIFSQKNLHVSKKSSIFAKNFNSGMFAPLCGAQPKIIFDILVIR